MSEYTTLLYAKPSFHEGLARVLDIGATFDAYNDSPSPGEADYVATVSDWYAVGADLLHAINRFAKIRRIKLHDAE
jgi:hypothetical protein